MPTCRLMLPLPRHSLALAPGAPTAAFAPGRRKPPSCWRSSHSCPLWARPDPGRPGPLSDESRVGSPPGIQPRSFSGRSTRRATPSSSGSAEAAQLPDAVGSLDVATCTGASLLSALATREQPQRNPQRLWGETVRAVPSRELTTIRDAATTACAPGDCPPIRPIVR
jgi:hypothetical protein